MRRILGLASVLLVWLLTGTATAVPPPRYFPLDVGTRWTYTEERFGSERVVTVLEYDDEAEVTRVDFFGTQVSLSGPPDAIDIELPEEGFVHYYRFPEESWVHRDFQGCDDGRVLTRAGTETVTTPAGEFADALRLEYGQGTCSDAGTGAEWWVLEVGRVKWVEDSFAGPRVWVLKQVEHNIPMPGFRRSDANSSSEVDISDAVYTLNWLFGGGETPVCQDAADANDDGVIDLSDAVYTLAYLFVSGDPPPAPGPAECGADPTEDALPACPAEGCPALGITAEG
jgi:hypothetical protein